MSSQVDSAEYETLPPRRGGWSARLAGRLLSLVETGRLTVVLPSGEAAMSRQRLAGPEAVIVLKNWTPIRRLFLSGDAAFAQSYIDGDWETPDLLALFEVALANRDRIIGVMSGSVWARTAQRIGHFLRRNSRAGSRKNIAFHYDLGNAFYRLWLDEKMIYSSGVYDAADETLEIAQARKLDLITDALNAGPSDRVLEIGCGWGALAVRLAQSGASVTGLTLSTEQLSFAKAAAGEHGLQDKIDLRLQDYRDVEGSFDRIVSIEMLEAVGEAYWPVYFRTLADRLAPGGTGVLQAITISEALYPSYRAAPDFIQQCVFPGGMLPTVDIMRRAAAACGLTITPLRQFGKSYALTLAEWRRRFHARTAELDGLGFDAAFRRMWDYYFVYCEAGFRAGLIDVGLFGFTKDAAKS